MTTKGVASAFVGFAWALLGCSAGKLLLYCLHTLGYDGEDSCMLLARLALRRPMAVNSAVNACSHHFSSALCLLPITCVRGGPSPLPVIQGGRA